jgi:hypothetical protein
MKNFTLVELAFAVLSEPGDGTRYEYAVVKDGAAFHFVDMSGHMQYPSALNYHFVRGAHRDDILYLAKEEGVNPYTYAECARTAIQLMEKESCGKFIDFGLSYRKEDKDDI